MSNMSNLRLECVSNSTVAGVGKFTTPDGESLLPSIAKNPWTLNNPFLRPGLLRLIRNGSLTQGVYTCIIPDSNNKNISINVGLYPYGFRGDANFYFESMGNVCLSLHRVS